jgi:hypothetical protein
MTDDMMSILRARIQEANIAIDRGNLPYAETLLDDTIRRAKESGYPEVRATAIHDRALVANRRGKFDEALVLQYEAFKGVRNQMARDRVLNDLGTSFVQLGVYSAARDAYLVVAATAQEQYLRWTATINLLDVAVYERREPLFEQYRRELDGVSLPAALAPYYFLFMAQGYRAFDKPGLAKAAAARAAEISASHQLGQAEIEAEQLLCDLDADELRAERAERAASRNRTWSPEVQYIANAIHEIRTVAGVGE